MRNTPTGDPPLKREAIDYIGRRLAALGIKPDRPWLVVATRGSDAIPLESHSLMLTRASMMIPTSNAQWELSAFFAHAIGGAAFDVQWLESFDEFEVLYRNILGERARPFLPALYLAAAALPNSDADKRVRLVTMFDTERLRYDD